MSVSLTASWAARAFARYDKPSVDRIVQAVAAAGVAAAAEHARLAVQETGFGVPAHQELANLACAQCLGADDLVSPRLAGTLRLPRPLGVILARTPPVIPVAAVYRTVLAALATRNALVISPHPAARSVSTRAALALAEAAVAAGAPEGVIQVTDAGFDGADLVLAPPDQPDNVPVIVDGTADLARAAVTIVDSKAFDNSTVDGAPSVLVVTSSAADRLVELLRHAGGHLLRAGERVTDQLPGRDAGHLAGLAGIAVPTDTRVLMAPFDLAGPEEPLARPKPYPLMGLLRVATPAQAVAAARAVLRLGAGRRAAVHSTDLAALPGYLAGLPVARVSVNGADDNVAAWVGADPAPENLVRWTTIVAPGPELPAPPPATAPVGPVPAYPHASNGS
ncbi:MAG: acetaldehyde dehydrogenase / alcohol dehydrogenase [Micromonosporaceae bacterium]